MANSFNYTISTDTLNGVLSNYSLTQEIQASAITIALDDITSSGDIVTINFKTDLPTGEIPTLTGLVNAHTGIELQIPDHVAVDESPAFASKYTKDGKSLFKRVHGTSGLSVPVYDPNDEANTVKTLEFTVPYPEAKFTGADILGTELGDFVDFTVHDTDTGAITSTLAATGYTAIPNFQLNQFGFNVVMTDKHYSNTSQYDASLYMGMKLRAKIKNMGSTSKTYYMNVELHEVK